LDAPVKPSQTHFQKLLVERQSHWGEETMYFHDVNKIIDKVGVEQFSELKFIYNPSHETIALHTLRLYRDGKWFDRLQTSRYQLIQREAELEDNLYSGRLTLVYFLSDLREQDIVEYAFSCYGNNPVLHPYHEGHLYFQGGVAVEKIYYRILTNPTQPLFFKPFHTEQEPTLFGPNEWVWEVTASKEFEQEPWTPYWYNPLERVQLTQFGSWREVVSHILPFYSQHSQLHENPEALALVQEWQAASSDKGVQALMALRFVQDQVRYFGFVEGIGATKPAPAHETFERRSGDCKGKTLLLQALLGMMEITSSPVLIAHDIKDLNTYLPTLTSFTHVVLQIQMGDNVYYVDPTITLQGGSSLAETYFPDFGWGLVLNQGTESLTPLPRYHVPNPTTISTLIRLTSPEMTESQTTFLFYGQRAEIRRRELQHLGVKKFAESYSQELPKKAKPLSIPEVADDRARNIFSLSFSYQLPTTSRLRTKSLPFHSYLLNMNIDDDLKPERKTPYALIYPFWIKEHIRVENRFNTWEFEVDEMVEENSTFRYKYFLQKADQVADFDLEFCHFQDHLDGEMIQKYYDLMQRLEPPEPLDLFRN
jgi:hypothetical protein